MLLQITFVKKIEFLMTYNTEIRYLSTYISQFFIVFHQNSKYTSHGKTAVISCPPARSVL